MGPKEPLIPPLWPAGLMLSKPSSDRPSVMSTRTVAAGKGLHGQPVQCSLPGDTEASLKLSLCGEHHCVGRKAGCCSLATCFSLEG